MNSWPPYSQAPQISQTEKSKANEWNRHHLSAALKLNQAFVLPVLHHHPFGFAGRAGGINHICQVRRAHPDVLQIVAFSPQWLFQRQHRHLAVTQRLSAELIRQQQHRR